MEKSTIKVKNSRVEKISKSTAMRKKIAEIDILRKAYEVYMENSKLAEFGMGDLFRTENERGESESPDSSETLYRRHCIQL